MNKYKVIAICGKSAAGKDTFLQQMLLCANPQKYHEIISHTSRPPREKEVDGKNYYFISKDNFIEKILNNEMLEYAQYNDWYYGTSFDGLDSDKINIGVFNRKGLASLSNCPCVDLYVVMVSASAKVRLMRSLNREENPDVDEIVRRYLADEEEWKGYIGPNFFLSNDGQGIDIKHTQEIIDKIFEDANHHWAKKTN